VNVWLAAATTALVGLELAGTLVTVVLVLLAEGFHRSSYFVLPLVLGGLSFVGALVFIRFLGDRWL
jgi:multicomponent Na+:H+ antiporter subunit F